MGGCSWRTLRGAVERWLTGRSAVSASSSTRRQGGEKVAPASVSDRRRVVRFSSRTPRRSSRRATCLDTADLLTPSRRAGAGKPPHSTTPPKNGRGPLRERKWTEMLVSGGSVSLKKKNKTK